MLKKLLIANRGEIAIRIARSAAELGITSMAVYSEDDAASLHLKAADVAVALTGHGAAAYLDAEQLIRLAIETGCDAVHPGYGFLSESAIFARQCEQAKLIFIGPSPAALEVFGDKLRARQLAFECGVPTLTGSRAAVTAEEAAQFMQSLGPGSAVMLKAVAGGGGRGMRPVLDINEIAAAYARCSSEALQSFGAGGIYAEQFLPHARHIEVQILGDGKGVVHLWDRDCSLQRQRQKIIEIAPALGLPATLRQQILDSALALARKVQYRGAGTVEFLVDPNRAVTPYAFIEANPRLQVEHPVTEAVLGLDLVILQLKIAGGASLADLDLKSAQLPRGVAIQCRINMESMQPDGSARAAAGVLGVYEPCTGPGIRVDGFGYGGYATSTRYDSLLAKVIVHSDEASLAAAARKAMRALSEFRIEGVPTNLNFLRALLARTAVETAGAHTNFIDENCADLVSAALALQPAETLRQNGAGTRLASNDPLAVLHHGKGVLAARAMTGVAPTGKAHARTPAGTVAAAAPMQGTIISIDVQVDQPVRHGDPLFILESMKMEHVIAAQTAGYVRAIEISVGDTVLEGHLALFIEPAQIASDLALERQTVDLDYIRPDLEAVLNRQRGVLDANRPEAVARRRKTSQRTTRENLADLLDEGSFIEYGALTVAARRQRHSTDELIRQTPADGMIMGLGRVNGRDFADDASRCAVMAYDYTVLAGTQGAHNHLKMDRLAELASRWRLPTFFFCEGGGGRPGDTESGGGMVRGFELWARMSAIAPMIGITSGRCFAGNASALGCCDVIIATLDSNIGMGGPAMIEGGGLGIFRPEEIGPIEVQRANGVVDIVADDEAHAVHLAKQYVSYFQGPLTAFECADQRALRHVIPENRLRVYDIRDLVRILADQGSVLELRADFGVTMFTALIRLEGRPLGVIANNPKFLGGAIDSDGSDKAARFLQICEAFDIPVLSLSDTPGMMVGPEIEQTALVRHCSRLFVIGANLTVPLFSIVLRKSYGLGALAMTGGSYPASMFSVAWPTGEFGGMGLEGAVKLGYRNELAAIPDPEARRARFEEMVAAAYESGKALNYATTYAIDDVIDPADTRRWIITGLRSLPRTAERTAKKLRWIDAW